METLVQCQESAPRQVIVCMLVCFHSVILAFLLNTVPILDPYRNVPCFADSCRMDLLQWGLLDRIANTNLVVWLQTFLQSMQLDATRFPDAAKAAEAEAQWHCPKCRAAYGRADTPSDYLCFCKKTLQPAFDPWLSPHTCGERCLVPTQRQRPAGGFGISEIP